MLFRSTQTVLAARHLSIVEMAARALWPKMRFKDIGADMVSVVKEIGRASCRERV